MRQEIKAAWLVPAEPYARRRPPGAAVNGAGQTGLDLSALHRIEIGQTVQARRDTIIRIAQVFGMTEQEWRNAVPEQHPPAVIRVDEYTLKRWREARIPRRRRA